MNVKLLEKLGLAEIDMEAGTVLLQEGHKGDKVYVLVDGEVVVKARGKMLAEIYDPGTILGEISALLGTPHVATVSAAKQSTFYMIPNFMSFILEHPEACVSVAQVLAVRLINMNNHFVTLKERIENMQKELENYLPIFPETSG